MRRTYMNIAAFLALSGILSIWSVTNYLPLGLFDDPRIVTAEFAESPGLRPGYEVTYLGRSVGRIESVDLVPGFSEVELAIDDGVDLPKEVVAAARRRSAIGEPYVDLEPAPGVDADGGPRLADGDRIPVDRTTSPIQYGELFRALDLLVRELDGDALATVVEEAFAALEGRGEDIRRIVVGVHELARNAEDNGEEIETLIDDLGTIAGVLADHRQAIGTSITSLHELAVGLDEARPAFEDLLTDVPPALATVNGIVEASDDALVCTIDGLASLEGILNQDVLAATVQLLERSAPFAEVVALLRNPDDGIFQLLISVNTGEPPVVQYTEPLEPPSTPETPACPLHDAGFEPTPLAAVQESADGGTRPAQDRPDIAIPGTGDPDQSLASGISDVEADDPAMVRLARTAVPWLLLFLLVAVVWYLVKRRMTSGS